MQNNYFGLMFTYKSQSPLRHDWALILTFPKPGFRIKWKMYNDGSINFVIKYILWLDG